MKATLARLRLCKTLEEVAEWIEGCEKELNDTLELALEAQKSDSIAFVNQAKGAHDLIVEFMQPLKIDAADAGTWGLKRKKRVKTDEA